MLLLLRNIIIYNRNNNNKKKYIKYYHQLLSINSRSYQQHIITKTNRTKQQFKSTILLSKYYYYRTTTNMTDKNQQQQEATRITTDSSLGTVRDAAGSTTGMKGDGSLLKVKESCTVIVLRKNTTNNKQNKSILTRESCKIPNNTDTRTNMDLRTKLVFGNANEVAFISSWEVLMCQRQAINWLRSKSITNTTQMRYPCEYNFAGGTCEANETIEETALRELCEEINIPQIPLEEANLKLFSVKQTRPVRGTSNIMYNFIMFANENKWLPSIDSINQSLHDKETYFYENIILNNNNDKTLQDRFFNNDMPIEEKELISPEMHQVNWLPLDVGIRYSFTSMNRDLFIINEYQQEQFNKYHIKNRDPLFITMQVLCELEQYPTVETLETFLKQQELIGSETLKQEVMWLKDGLTEEEVSNIFNQRNNVTKRDDIYDAQYIRRLRDERLAAAGGGGGGGGGGGSSNNSTSSSKL